MLSGCGRARSGFKARRDLSFAGIPSQRRRAYRDLPITIVTPSRWLGDRARSSPLLSDFRSSVYPMPSTRIAFARLQRTPRAICCGLPTRQEADSVRRGARRRRTAQRASAICNRRCDCWRNALARHSTRPWFSANLHRRPPDVGMACTYVGRVHDDARLAALYAAADVFVAPSTRKTFPIRCWRRWPAGRRAWRSTSAGCRT